MSFILHKPSHAHTRSTSKTSPLLHLTSLWVSVQVVGVCSREYIPKGTRFGPLVGEIYTADSVPKDANRKYFWRVSAHTSSEAGGTTSCDITCD